MSKTPRGLELLTLPCILEIALYCKVQLLLYKAGTFTSMRLEAGTTSGYNTGQLLMN